MPVTFWCEGRPTPKRTPVGITLVLTMSARLGTASGAARRELAPTGDTVARRALPAIGSVRLGLDRVPSHSGTNRLSTAGRARAGEDAVPVVPVQEADFGYSGETVLGQPIRASASPQGRSQGPAMHSIMRPSRSGVGAFGTSLTGLNRGQLRHLVRRRTES